jgi:hypothetical protein
MDLPENAKQITIVGTKIVPEFGLFAMAMLGIAFTSIVVIQKSRTIPKF